MSHQPLAEGETVEDEDDAWLDNIALLTFDPYQTFPPFPKLEESTILIRV